MRSPWTMVGVFMLVSSALGAGPDISTPDAKPYEVVGSVEQHPSNGRTARHWYIVSESKSFEEHAQTLVRAATDLYREHGLDLTYVTLYPSKTLVGSGLRYATGFYAADGRAGEGFPGADPDYRATWSVLATRGVLGPTQLKAAELRMRLAPEFPSREMASSSGVDEKALRSRIAQELHFDVSAVQPPHLELARWQIEP